MNLPDLFPIANHLWQATLFATAAGLLTLTLRRNHARVRHGVWLAASIKFVLPFSLLIALGGQLRWSKSTIPETTPPVAVILMDEVSQPFTSSAASLSSVPAKQQTASPLPAILVGIWLCGFLGLAASWWIRWRRIRAAVRAGSAVDVDSPVDVGASGSLGTQIRAISSPMNMEPGVFGVFRPTLLLPEGIADRLTPTQLNTVIAHELCHIRHRDNLIAAFQMFVETVFWFHPLVWWIGKRMVAERERACDEEVLRDLCAPRAYADAILRICRSYVESPVVCVSGVAGANLTKRIEEIMANRVALKLNAGRKLLLAGVGALAVILPVAMGLLNAPTIQAQAQPGKTLAFEAASVKAMATLDRTNMMPPSAYPGGRFISKFPIYQVIAYAYRLPFNPSVRLSGIPAALGVNSYDIEATGTMPAGLSPQAREDRTRMMVQTLLADRFRMVIHKETREMPVYALVVGKGGPKLQKADIEEKDCPDASVTSLAQGPRTPDPNSCHNFNGGQGRGLDGRAVDMSDLVSHVENWTHRPLLDKTGIHGLFHIQTRPWQPMDAPPLPGAKAEGGSDLSDLPTLFQIFEGLGLKMEARTDKADVYVVDHIEKPSEN